MHVASIRARSCRKSRAHGFSRPRYELSPIISVGIFHKHCETLDTTKETPQNKQKSQLIIATTVNRQYRSDQRSSWLQIELATISMFSSVRTVRGLPLPSWRYIGTCIFKFLDQKAHWTEGPSLFWEFAHHALCAPSLFLPKVFIAFFEAGETFSDKKRN